jgi:MFS family permease
LILRSYYLYQAAANCVFFQPIFFIYYQRHAGLGAATVLWLESYNTAVRALLDFPLGALADRTSRRRCLVVAAAAVALGATALLVRPGLAVAVGAETLFAAASALRYDALATG